MTGGAPLPARLPKVVAERIRRHCEEQYPREACGAIFGSGDGDSAAWEIVEVSAAPNEHEDDQRRRYLIPPAFQLEAEHAARAKGLDVVGFYHSHPDHPGLPSEYDRAHAWVGYLYVICAVAQGRSAELNGFTLDEPGGKFLGVELRG